MVGDILRSLKAGLPDYLLTFVNHFIDGGPVNVTFPDLLVDPHSFIDGNSERLHSFKGMQDLHFTTAGKKVVYNIIVK